jgi:ADP-ribose pyrophosphatase YjhB (NUDIX family)
MTLQVGVKALLCNPEGKVLLLLRSAKYETAEGTWDIPGGRIDADAPLRESLDREIREETKLALSGEPMLAAAQDIFFSKSDGEKMHIVRLTYVGTASGEPVLDGEEHTEYKWVAFSELSGISNLDPYLKELVLKEEITEDSWG